MAVYIGCIMIHPMANKAKAVETVECEHPVRTFPKAIDRMLPDACSEIQGHVHMKVIETY